MSLKNRDLHSFVNDLSRGSALSTTRSEARSVDVFAAEINENSLLKWDTAPFILLPASIPFLIVPFDGSEDTLRLDDFFGLTQFFIILPFIAFLTAITFTWFFAFSNHIQRVAAVKRYPPVRRYTLLSLACGTTSVTNLLAMDVNEFNLYWGISLTLLVFGYAFAILVGHHFYKLIDEIGQRARNVTIAEWMFWKLSGHYPLGETYKEISNDERILIYDRRVREMQSIKNIVGGWRVSNTTLAIFMAIYALSTFSLSYTWELERNYIVQQVIQNQVGSTQPFSTLRDHLLYSVEVLVLLSLVIIGVLTASLRSIINTTVYSDEVYLLNATSPLDILRRGASDGQIGATEQSAASRDGSNALNKQILEQLAPLSESARLVSSIASSMLLWVVSGESLYSLLFFLFLTFSFLINDLVDFMTGKDLICHPRRPLPSGRLTVKVSAVGAAVVLVLLLSLSSFTTGSSFQTISIMIATGLSFIYSLAAKRLFPAIGTIVWVIAVAIAFLGAMKSIQPLPVYFLFFLTFYSRELLLDIRDINADKLFARGATIGVLGEGRLLSLFPSSLFAITAAGYLALVPNSLPFSVILITIATLAIFVQSEKGKRSLGRASVLAYSGALFLITA